MKNRWRKGKAAVGLDPDFAIGYTIVAYSDMYLNRLDQAESILRAASERKLEIPEYFVQRYDIAFLKDDSAGMKREATLAQAISGAEDWISNHQAFVFAYSGRLQESRRISRQATDLALRAGQRERAALYQAGAAVREALFVRRGKPDSYGGARTFEGARDVEYGAAFALAFSGNSPRSQALINDLERRFPEDTSVQFSYVPTVRALIALKDNKPSNAIDLLQSAIPNELGAPESSFFGFFGALYPVFVNQGAQAAAEFQNILDHRGIVVSDPVGALARLQLGRAFAISGDKTKAKNAYQDFLTLWRDADPDIPILKQAKAEYAKLQ
jgi:eukaryotic-like serine/threonine-protein kinase